MASLPPQRAPAIASGDLREAPSTDLRILIDPGDVSAKRVCLFVSYSPDYSLKPHVQYHLAALRASGLSIVYILIANELRDQFVATPPAVSGFIVRKNAGFDFGAWADTFRVLPGLWQAEAIVLVNDSVFGPIGDLPRLVDTIMRQPADFIGLTESVEIARHYQSYFLVLKDHALANGDARAFWSNIENYTDKRQVILNYEVMLLRKYEQLGLRCAAMLSWRHAPGEERISPVHARWRQLLQHGFPYIKVDLLRDWGTAPYLKGWRDFVTDPVLLAAIDFHLARAGSSGQQR